MKEKEGQTQEPVIQFYCWHKDCTGEDACKEQCKSCKESNLRPPPAPPSPVGIDVEELLCNFASIILSQYKVGNTNIEQRGLMMETAKIFTAKSGYAASLPQSSTEEEKGKEVKDLPTTSDLFKKHFGDTPAVGIKHPNIESFFSDLNEVCLEEDKRKSTAKPAQSLSILDLKKEYSKWFFSHDFWPTPDLCFAWFVKNISLSESTTEDEEKDLWEEVANVLYGFEMGRRFDINELLSTYKISKR